MTDRSLGAVRVTATRIGRTDLGAGSATVDDDALTVMVRSASGDERPVRVPLSSIDAVSLSAAGDELTLGLRDGTRLALLSSASSKLHDYLLVRCRVLPELTRALRTFGSRRGRRSIRATAAADQQRFFSPLLGAKRVATGAIGSAAIVAAFDAATLATECQNTVQAFVVERHPENGPARRALEAELSDLAEPLLDAVRALGAAADELSASLDDLRLWRVWAGQLRTTFEVADRVWLSLDVVLDMQSLSS